MRKNRAAAIFFAFFSTYICVEAWRLGLGTWHKPGPGFMAFYVGIVLGILALVVLFERTGGKPGQGEGQASWRGSGLCFLSLLGYVVLLTPLGFIPTTFLFIAFIMKVVERKPWRTSLVAAFLVAVAAYGLFDVCLKSSLPKGIMEIVGL